MTQDIARLRELSERLRGTKPHCNFGSDLCARDARDAGAAIDALLAQLEAATARIGVLSNAVKNILPIGDASKPDNAVFPVYVTMGELRALHDIAARALHENPESKA